MMQSIAADYRCFVVGNVHNDDYTLNMIAVASNCEILKKKKATNFNVE